MTEPTTRDRILAAAREVLAERGLAAATMQEIRRRAGVSNGSLFHFFPTKEAISAAVYLEAIAAYQGGMVSLLSDDVDAETTVRRLVRYHLEWTIANRGTARFLLELGHPARGEALAEQVAAANREFRDALERWLHRMVAQSRLRPCPVDVAIACLIGPAQLICRGWLVRAEGESPLHLADALEQAAWDSLRANR